MTTVVVKGLDEIGRALAEFPVVLGKKYLRRATYEAAKVISADAVARASAASLYPAAMQQIAKNIAVFARRTDSPGIAHYAVGVRRVRISKKVAKTLRILRRSGQGVRIENDTFFWYWYEFGAADKGSKDRTTKSGKSTGRIRAQPFLRPAFEATKMKAIDVFKLSLSEFVEKAAREVAAK